MTMKSRIAIFVALCGLSLPSFAYQLQATEWLVKPTMGGRINVVTAERNTPQASPGGGFLIGADLEYMVDKSTSAILEFHPFFASGFIEVGFGVGAKYRFDGNDIPLIPYGAATVTFGWLLPTMAGPSTHFNMGLRPAIGLDYFVTRDMAIGLEFGCQPTLVLISGTASFDLSLDVLLGMTWRL